MWCHRDTDHSAGCQVLGRTPGRGTLGESEHRCRVRPGRPSCFSAGGFPRPALVMRTCNFGCIRLSMCSCHCWFSLCLHHTYPPPRLNRANGAPVFTSGLRDQQFGCEHTGPLRHVTGFPGLGLLRVLRPIPAASAGNKPSRRPAQCRPVREPVGWFPRSVSNRSTGSAPNYAPATSPRLRRRHSPWPPSRRHQPAKESPHTQQVAVGVCAATRP